MPKKKQNKENKLALLEGWFYAKIQSFPSFADV